MDRSALVAVVSGALQGVFEWLPVSSEGNVTVFLTALGESPETAVQFSLFLHAGTALSAAAYYRDELDDVAAALLDWRPGGAFADGETATLSFLGVATLISGVVGIAAYATLEQVVSELTGGAFVTAVGVLLVATGLLQRVADRADRGGPDASNSSPLPGLAFGGRESPDLADAVLVGALQGLAVLPGVSRSGTTASALLVRGHDGPSAFRLSFLLSIPAALGAGALVLADVGVPAVEPLPAALALGTAAVVGYLTIDALMRVVERVPFWGVCVGLGALAVAGGAALAV